MKKPAAIKSHPPSTVHHPPFTIPRRGRLGLKSFPAGVTLIELLIVVSIVVLLAGVMVPMMRPALEEQGVREAARTLNAYFAKAQALAAERGRPVGVWIEPSDNDNQVAFQLYIAESPPPYSGDSLQATATISGWTASLTAASFLSRLVNVGDPIRFNYQGPLYNIKSVNPTSVNFEPTDLVLTSIPRTPPNGAQVPYQIFRKPIRSAANSITLPRPAVIDLSASGLGASGMFPVSTEPLIITFHPAGGIERVYINDVSFIPLEPIHLLIGRMELAGPPITRTDKNDPPPNNLQDPRSRWVTIGHRTGLVSTSLSGANPDSTGNVLLPVARQYARQAQNMGGR